MRKKHLAPAVALVLMVSGCARGRATAPWSEWTFRATVGWHTAAARFPSSLFPALPVRRWESPDSRQTVRLELVAGVRGTPGPIWPLQKAVGETAVCRGRRALLLQLREPFSSAEGADGVKMQYHGTTATAWYYYPRTASPDPEAEAAIESICPR